VRKDCQRQGIGRALLGRLANWFAAHDRRKICVGIDLESPYKSFYEKHGAAYINAHWLVWDDIGRVA